MHVIRVLSVQATVAALALCVVWQSSVARQSGYRLEELRREIASSEAEVHKYEAQLSKLKSPQRILSLLDQFGLDLLEPSGNAGESPARTGEPDGASPTDVEGGTVALNE